MEVVADGHPSTLVPLNILPGQTESVRFRFTAETAAAPVLLHTPTLSPVQTHTPDSTRPCA